MTFGLTDSGFNKKTLTDVLQDINQATIDAFGSPNVAPDSVFGQYNGIISEVASDLWDLADLVYGSQYALSAIGLSLDAVAELNNLKRLGATSSTVTTILEGVNGTVIPLGTQFKQSNTTEVLETSAPVTLSTTNLLKIVLSINTPATIPHAITMTKTIAGVPTGDIYSSNETVELTILTDLETQINSGGIYAAEVDTVNLTLTITNASLNDSVFFGASVNATFDIDEQWTPVQSLMVNTGALPIPANSVQQIQTPVVGLSSVDNLFAGLEGDDTETDDEFRLRRKTSLQVVGAASVPAIEARILQEVENVTAVTVKDNRTDITDNDGRPPHSFQAIVTGGADQDIWDKIWEVKSAGIETHGLQIGTVSDSSGDLQTMRFDRPLLKYIHFDIEITLNPEEVFPSNGIDAIKEALVVYGDTLNAGDDVIRQRFFNAIYSIPGVKNITLFECATTENPGDTPATISVYDIDSEPVAGTYELQSGATLTADGVITGMVVTENGGSGRVTSVKNIVTETRFVGEEDVFSAGEQLDFGGFGDTDIGMNDNEISQFTETNISVVVV